MESKISITVLVPSYKRPNKLKTCLEHLSAQTRKADQIIVVLRSEDAEGIKVAEAFSPILGNLEIVFTVRPGVVAAENVGLSKVSSQYVAFLDDDGYAPEDWIYKIEQFFNSYKDASALGGSDIIKSEPWSYHDVVVDRVGLITWYGKIIGNHHRKCQGKIREVQVLKGVNMIFKRDTFKYLDEQLAGIEGHLGNGSQWELDLCLTLLNNSKKIYFDPTLVVVHDSDHSKHDYIIAAKNNAHNISYVMKKHLSFFSWIIFFFYAHLVGNEQLPGILKLFIDLINKKNVSVIKHFKAKLTGFCEGIKTYRKAQG